MPDFGEVMKSRIGAIAPYLYALSSSAGLVLGNSSGQACLTLGVGGGQSATFADGVNITGVLDQSGMSTLQIGINNATAITIGKAGITTTNAGAFTSSELLTASVGVTVGTGTPAANRITLASSAMRVGGGTTAGGSLDAGTTPVISWTNTSVTLAQNTTVTRNDAYTTLACRAYQSAGTNYHPLLVTFHARGTSSSPTQTKNGDQIAAWQIYAYSGVGDFAQFSLDVTAASDITSSGQSTISFKAGSTQFLSSTSAGAVTVGPSGSTANNLTLNGSLNLAPAGASFTAASAFPYIGSKTSSAMFANAATGGTYLANGIYYESSWKHSTDNRAGSLVYVAGASGSGTVAFEVQSSQSYSHTAPAGATLVPLGSCTHAGSWVFGPSVINSTVTHTMRTRQGTLAASTYGFGLVTDNSATGDIVLLMGLDKTSKNAWIAPYEEGVGKSAGLRFGAFSTDIGGYNSSGTWEFGPVSTAPAISTHAVYGAMAAFFDGANPVTCTTTASTGSARQMIRFRLGATTPLGGTNSGGITATDGTTSPAFYTGSSDRRLKKDIQDAPLGALARLCAVRLRDFRMTEDTEDAPFNRGVIAQELAEVYPEKVHTRDDGFLYVSMGYDWEFIQAIQELASKMDARDAVISELSAKLDAEKARNDALEARLAQVA